MPKSKITPGYRRPCAVCGQNFSPRHFAKKYCSIGCQNKARYAVQLTTARKLQALCNQIKMDQGCLDCGYKLHPAALQFDHIPGRGAKVKDVSRFTDAKKMRLEMLKCEVRCANCHFIKTMERRMMKRALTPEQERNIQMIVERLVTFGTLRTS